MTETETYELLRLLVLSVPLIGGLLLIGMALIVLLTWPKHDH